MNLKQFHFSFIQTFYYCQDGKIIDINYTSDVKVIHKNIVSTQNDSVMGNHTINHH